jgi:hypothetical protein
MKQLKLLVCVLALASLALFTGCGGDDNNNNGGNNPPPTGTNAPATLTAGSTITATADDSSVTTIEIQANNAYHAIFADNTTEDGTFTYTPSGDTATLILHPTNNSGDTTATLTFTSPTDGSYTSDTVGNGTFTLTSPGA